MNLPEGHTLLVRRNGPDCFMVRNVTHSKGFNDEYCLTRFLPDKGLPLPPPTLHNKVEVTMAMPIAQVSTVKPCSWHFSRTCYCSEYTKCTAEFNCLRTEASEVLILLIIIQTISYNEFDLFSVIHVSVK